MYPAGLKYSISRPDIDGTTLQTQHCTCSDLKDRKYASFVPTTPQKWMWLRFSVINNTVSLTKIFVSLNCSYLRLLPIIAQHTAAQIKMKFGANR